jgi:TrmH family RNA methyltransferase
MAKAMKKFEITSAQNPKVKHWTKLRLNRDYRYQHKKILVEGVKLVRELGNLIETLIVISESLIPKNCSPKELYIVTPTIMNKISGVESPEGILAEVSMPVPAYFEKVNFLLALDGVSDPGNLGTLLRTALALGWDGAFILDNSCDPFNEKAIRAAKGATFRLPLKMGSWKELQQIVNAHNLTPLVADTEGENLLDWKRKKKILLVLGNEAHGASVDAERFCNKIKIPMLGEMESLNVAIAGGILMFVLRN